MQHDSNQTAFCLLLYMLVYCWLVQVEEDGASRH